VDKNWWHPLAGMLVAALLIGIGVLAVLAQ
jgi:hypothetical protein